MQEGSDPSRDEATTPPAKSATMTWVMALGFAAVLATLIALNMN